MTDEQLRTAVNDELCWDGKVDPHAVSVLADDGVVTLRGTVLTFAQKRDADRAARRVRGVTGVQNELEVVLPTEQRRADAELRGAVLQALALDTHLPDSVDAHADGGWITLTGTAAAHYQRVEAEHIVERVPGVAGFNDEIELVATGPTAADVEDSIDRALRRVAHLDADAVTVRCSSGTVTLSGTVSSWAEHDDVITGAWNAPGVVDVVDTLTVAS
jgi:osmotically-inducible protein OsmY